MEYMNDIKVGDSVRCINSGETCFLSTGRIYIVLSIGYSIVNNYKIYYIINNGGAEFSYSAHKFEYDLISNRRLKLEHLSSLQL